jgi:hypothetical protein
MVQMTLSPTEISIVLDAAQKRDAWIAAHQRGADKEAIKAADVALREAEARKRKTPWCLPARPLV